jgi:carbamoyltransferase
MIICGLKLTHDGAVALLEDNELICSVEIEKLANNPRHSPVADLRIIVKILADFGYAVGDVDEWVIDGWNGDTTSSVSLANDGEPLTLTVAPYRENDLAADVLQASQVGEFTVGDDLQAYTSYLHVTGHIASAYCTSAFAALREPSLVLVWDGGMFPRLYHVDPGGEIENGGEIFPVVGGIYPTAAHHFGPYRREDDPLTVDDLSVAGKLMAYIALGRARSEIIATLQEAFQERFESCSAEAVAYREAVGGWGIPFDPSLRYLHGFFHRVRGRLAPGRFCDEDVLASVHAFLERLLLERLVTRVRDWKGDGPWNLCLAGGCALNIKWNSALRAHPMFAAVWVPPFPNDSGSALGTACAHLIAKLGITAIKWDVRRGPVLRPTVRVVEGWQSSACAPEDLAHFMHETGEPVVVVNGRAELGPRALGNRSILAPATNPRMKDRLNEIKGRERFRPVAPICLAEFAADIFDPGEPDPHMLFDHQVRSAWVDRIPAVLHLDGTARLQTVCREDDATLERILREYHRLSGIPVLCNTSANDRGRGFFPDAASAMAWGRLDTVWSDGTLYQHETRGRGPAVPTMDAASTR